MQLEPGAAYPHLTTCWKERCTGYVFWVVVASSLAAISSGCGRARVEDTNEKVDTRSSTGSSTTQGKTDPATGASSDTSGSSSTDEAPEIRLDQACEEACVGHSFRLPQALCEDFNLEQSYEFCHSEAEGGCLEHCLAVREDISASCANVLPRVLSCVAQTGFYASNTLPTGPCLFQGCEEPLIDMVAACSDHENRLAQAEALWANANLTEYSYVIDEQLVEVSGGIARVLSNAADFEPQTMEDLFEDVRDSMGAPGEASIVQYDAALGYPLALGSLKLRYPGYCFAQPKRTVSQFNAGNVGVGGAP